MHTVAEPETRYYVYVWELPVRLFHWANVVLLGVLGVTGWLIGNPLALQSASEASHQYWFGQLRFIHFTSAYLWVFNSVVRIYWGFVGNRYVRFHNFIPYRREQWAEILSVVRMDVLQIYRGATFSIGHNALAGLFYAVGFLAFLFQTVTGFALYAAMSESWIARSFAWVIPAMGGDHLVRLLHHGTLWFFVIFMLVHMYLTAYHDYVEATGTISSMFGGWKFVRRKPE